MATPGVGPVVLINGSDPSFDGDQVDGDYARWLADQPESLMRERREQAELIFRRVGITFAVYGDKDSGEIGRAHV